MPVTFVKNKNITTGPSAANQTNDPPKAKIK
jgi:hypothetical protein